MAVLVMVLLLTVMTYPTPHQRFSSDLPKVRIPHFIPGALRDDAIVITILRDGRIYLRNNQVTAKELPREIRDSLRDGAEKRIYIRADAHVYYRVVRDVLSEIRQANVESISFFVNGR